MSVVQNMTPLGGQRGSARVSGRSALVFEAGTVEVECRIRKPEALGPKGWKAGMGWEEAIMEVPDWLWVVVVRTTGGRVGVAIFSFGRVVFGFGFGFGLKVSKVKGLVGLVDEDINR